MMKSLVVAAFLLASVNVSAQEPLASPVSTGKEVPAGLPLVYLGFSAGFNNPSGPLGFDVSIPVHSNVTVEGGVGTSTWGSKLSAGARWYSRQLTGWGFGGGLTFNSGEESTTRELETIYGDRDVTLSLHNQVNLYLSAGRYWKLGRCHNRMFVEVGQSVRLQPASYSVLSGHTITADGDRLVRMMAPGGLMFRFGCSFGIYR